MARHRTGAAHPRRAHARHRCRCQGRHRKVAELAEKGLSVIFISSELEEVLRLAQRVAVLRDRRKIGELATKDVDLDGLVAYIAEGQAETTTPATAPETSPSDREKIA